PMRSMVQLVTCLLNMAFALPSRRWMCISSMPAMKAGAVVPPDPVTRSSRRWAVRATPVMSALVMVGEMAAGVDVLPAPDFAGSAPHGLEQELAIAVAAQDRTVLPVENMEAAFCANSTNARFDLGIAARICYHSTGVDCAWTDFELRFDQGYQTAA